MPVLFGRDSFEANLRGQDSPRGDKRVLHKGCSGHLHGAGVKKERASRKIISPDPKNCCLDDHEQLDGSSSDEAEKQPRRSQSSDYSRLLVIPPVASKPRSTSTNSAVAERLYSSPTKAVTAKLGGKYRAERTASDGAHMAAVLKADLNGGRSTNSLPRNRSKRERKSAEEDSGNFSSSEENNGTDIHNVVDLVTPSVNKQNLIHGTSDDELSIDELRRKQRQKRRDYLNARRESPSPTKRNSSPNNRGRKSSDEGASDSSYSPPASPSMNGIFRSTSNKSRGSACPESSGNSSKPRARSSNSQMPYAFGSSIKRFATDKALRRFPPPFLKQNSDGVQNGFNKMSELALSRTYSDPKYTYGRQNSRDKQEIAKAWLKFKEDIEAAMQKKPNSGYYKNLADMMTTKMESLNTTADQVGAPFFLTFCIHTGKKTFCGYYYITYLSWI